MIGPRNKVSEYLSQITSLKCVFFLTFAMVSASLGWIACVAVALPFLLLSSVLPMFYIHSKYRFITRFIAATFLRIITFFIITIYGTTLTTSGDNLSNVDVTTGKVQPVIILCNQRTRVDTLFMLGLFEKANLLPYLKIQLHSKLRAVPVVGWIFQYFQYMFVDVGDSTKWEIDRTSMLETMECLQDHTPCYLIYCEAEHITPTSLLLANEYSSSKGLTPRKYVLHPKVNTSELLINQLRETHPETLMVYDLTLAYEDYNDNRPTSEVSFANGFMPNNVHINVEKIMVSNIPSEENDTDKTNNEKSKFEKWINNRWERKEKDLKLYYESDEKIIHPFKNNLHVVFSSRCIPSMKIVLSILLTGVASYLYFSRFKFFVWTIFIGLQLLINICFDGVHQLEKRIRVSKKKTR